MAKGRISRSPTDEALIAFEANLDWIEGRYSELTEQYDGEYVAVLENRVIDHDKELKAIIQRLRERYAGQEDRIVVEFITKEETDVIL